MEYMKWFAIGMYLAGIVLLYFGYAYVQLELDIFKWTRSDREATVMLFFIWTVIWFACSVKAILNDD